MIIPQFWAEAKVREERDGKSYTVRRHGWSDVDRNSAQHHADERARDALTRILAGEALPRRERKTAYGVEGVPIREQIVSRHGDAAITRNAYGARCLNTPNGFFIDVDFHEGFRGAFSCLILATAFAAPFVVAYQLLPLGKFLIAAIPIAFAAVIFSVFCLLVVGKVWTFLRGGKERIARRRIDRFFASRGSWRWRLYRTPDGFRILVIHRPFDPEEEDVQAAFTALGADPLYALLCRKQRCFRARLTPKPWHMGFQRIPSRGVWPIPAERIPQRQAWVEQYERAAEGFAACRFEGEFGEGIPDSALLVMQRLHDQICRADSGLPIA